MKIIATHADGAPSMVEIGGIRFARDTANLIQALEPFARYYDLNDLHERHGQEALEVPVADLRRAWRALRTDAEATGNASPDSVGIPAGDEPK